MVKNKITKQRVDEEAIPIRALAENKIISPEDMKTSEIIDELHEDLIDERFDELDKEFLERYPFSYYIKSKFKETEEQIKQLNKLLRHYHKDDKILIEL